MHDTSTLLTFKGHRVRLTLADGSDYYGLLSGVTDDQLLVDGRSFARPELADAELAPLTCANCGKDTLRVFDRADMGMVCAACYRREASFDRPPSEPCEICGAKPAFRNPRSTNKPFLCTIHHAESGEQLVISTATAAHVMADCATEDVSSPKHEWRQVRKSRQRCIKCKRDKFESADLA